MFLHDQGDLFFPPVDRIVLQDLKQGINLRRGQRQLEDFTHEKGHDRAAAALLSFQMPDVRNGQIVGKVQCVIPIQVPVQGSGAETGRAEFLSILIDSLDALKKYFPVAKKAAVMVQIVCVYFKSSLPYLV